MSYYSNPYFISLRNILRKLGVTKFIASLTASRVYEDKFDTALRMHLYSGAVVWDVGANVGLYTKIFSYLVGDKGTVIAFEPSSFNMAKLLEATQALKNVKCLNYALGAEEGSVYIEQGVDELGATSQIKRESHGGIPTQMETAHGIILKGMAAVPNIVKIDVEGYEPDVLSGFFPVLNKYNEVKVIAIEVHFNLLQQRGLSLAPRAMESDLKKHNFQVDWIDKSHIIATRK
jgi:FkbM family methyltransferase